MLLLPSSNPAVLIMWQGLGDPWPRGPVVLQH